MQFTRQRRALVGAVAASTGAAAVVSIIATGGAASGAATQQFAFGASAYGSTASLGSYVQSGKTAAGSMCSTNAGVHRANKTAKVSLGLAGYIGAVTSNVHSTRTATKARSAASTHTSNTSLLGGVIQASSLSTSASVARYGTRYVPGGSSTIVGLRLAGQAMSAHPARNSVYALPGIGSVTVNGQHARTVAGTHTMLTTALNISINRANTLGLPAGHIVVGRSSASLRTVDHVASGLAYATQISGAKIAGSGRTAAVYSPCGGTGDATNSNDLAGVSIPNVTTSGAARSTVRTTDTAYRTTSASQNRIAGISLLGGSIKIRALTTRAVATLHDGKLTTSAAGTKLLGLVVAGQAQGTPRTGTKQTVPGLGTLYFGSAVKHHGGLMVYGLRVVLGQAQNGLPVGAVITVGAAGATVTG